MRTIIILCLIVTFWVPSFAMAETKVGDLNPPVRVTGRLGKPLGTRVVVEGVLAERTMLVNPLEVTAIDGQTLKQPVSIQIRGKVQIQRGTRYRLEGYESGEFAGPPSWLAPEAQQPFQFYSVFVVTKVIEPSSK